jgi:hypothetical protein
MKKVKEDLGANADARVHIFPTLKNIIINNLDETPHFSYSLKINIKKKTIINTIMNSLDKRKHIRKHKRCIPCLSCITKKLKTSTITSEKNNETRMLIEEENENKDCECDNKIKKND